MLWIRSHIKFAVNSGQLSSMNVLQVECQKRHGAEPMASPTNNSFTGRGFSGRKLTNRWNLKVLLLLLLHLFSMIRKNKIFIRHFVEIRPNAMPETESTVFRPDVIIRSGNLVMEISNTASEELVRKIRGLFHV